MSEEKKKQDVVGCPACEQFNFKCIDCCYSSSIRRAARLRNEHDQKVNDDMIKNPQKYEVGYIRKPVDGGYENVTIYYNDLFDCFVDIPGASKPSFDIDSMEVVLKEKLPEKLPETPRIENPSTTHFPPSFPSSSLPSGNVTNIPIQRAPFFNGQPVYRLFGK